MPTVNKKIAQNIIDNDGKFVTKDDDGSMEPPVVAIVVYNNAFNNDLSYAICYSARQLMGYVDSEFCRDLQLVWEAAWPEAKRKAVKL